MFADGQETIWISTHALREEGDGLPSDYTSAPMRISTHALREEGDTGRCAGLYRPVDFYPRPPRGGRQMLPGAVGGSLVISTHALREEGDSASDLTASTNC